MTLDKELAKGDKVDFHVHLYGAELDVIDAICARYECSRSAVIAAWTREYAEAELKGVKAGRRPGGGRPPSSSKKRGRK